MKKIIITSLVTLLAVNAEAASLATALQAKMDYLMARQNVVSGNIANASTPGFISKDIVYKPGRSGGGLAMRGTNSKHIRANGSTVAGFSVVEDRTFVRNDGNSVRIDEEMLKMARIQQEYTMATRLFTKHMSMQKLVVQK
jgi:flagellar basal-body rod protein FlgB